MSIDKTIRCMPLPSIHPTNRDTGGKKANNKDSCKGKYPDFLKEQVSRLSVVNQVHFESQQ